MYEIEICCKDILFETVRIKNWNGELPKVNDLITIESNTYCILTRRWDLDTKKIVLVVESLNN